MTTFQSGPATTCPRNLPQHFNGCTCVAAPGGMTSEVDMDLGAVLPEMGSSQADLLREQIEAVRREAYEAGQRHAFAKAGSLIMEFDDPAYALDGHVLKDPDGKFQVTVDHENGDQMAVKVLHSASESLRAYALGGFKEDAEKWAAGRTLDDEVDFSLGSEQPGQKVQCPKCADHPGYGYRISDTLASGSCDACNGTAEQIVPGDDAVECTYCYGSGMTDSTTECPVCRMGKMAPTPSGQDEVFVPGHGTFYRSGDVDGRTVGPGTPYAIRLEANRPLSDSEMQRAAQLLGYNYRATVAGESLGDPHRDSDRSFIVSADTTKSRRDDLGIALEEFEDNLATTLHEGSPVRTTDRKGPGTKGTRLVDGLHDSSLSFTAYYDDVC